MYTIAQLQHIIRNTQIEKQNLFAHGIDFSELRRLEKILSDAENELDRLLEAEAEELELINMEFIHSYA
jgi:hypothetical protein